MAKVYVYTEYGGPERECFTDMDPPTPGPGELLVRMRAAGVNPADWKLRANYHHRPASQDGPAPMGRELAGDVAETGPGVTDYAAGDRVFGIATRSGGWSEFALLATGEAARIPDGVSYADAATLSVAAATAYDAVVQLAPRTGETLLVTGGGGGVGIAAIQMARLRGAGVVATASPGKRDLVESAGARWVAYGAGEADRVLAAAPEGIDALLDNVGGETLLSLSPLVKGPKRFVSTADLGRAADLGGSQLQRTRDAQTLQAVARMVADGELDPHVTTRFPLARVGEALALVEAGHATGKVIVEAG